MEKVDTRSRIKYKDGGVRDEGDSTGKVHEGVSPINKPVELSYQNTLKKT